MRPSEALERHRDGVRAILARFNARGAMIFGSVARGDDEEGSDLDLIVDLGDAPRFYDVFRIEDALADLLGVSVDVHLPPHRPSRFSSEIQRDLRAL